MRSPAAALTLVAVVLAIGVARQALGASIDPLLLPVLSGQSTPRALGLVAGVSPQSDTGEPLLSISLRFSGGLDELRNLGIRFGGVLGDVTTAEVSVAQLRLLTSHPAVRSIEAARPLKPHLDLSVPDTGLVTADKDDPSAYPLPPLRRILGSGWTDTSVTGRGVLIGIIDTGIDLRHDDFLKPDGSTRALAVWDQSAAAGRPPRGFSYGAECAVDQINARDCPMLDREGHGTHVAGIAAGDGSATSSDEAAFRFIGMAPEADLLVVRAANLTSARVIDALDYLKTKAAALRKPLVVNMSFGTTLGPHDGTSNLDQAVDNFTRRDDETRPPDEDNRPGGVAVVSAGNDGQTALGNPLHAVGCLQTGSPPPACPAGIASLSGALPAVLSVVVPNATTTVALEIWYPGTATLGVAVTGPSECATPTASLAGSPVVTASTPCGTIEIGAGDTQPNGDRSSFVLLTSGAALRPGIWTLAVTGDVLPASGATRFDVWSAATPSERQVIFNTLGSAETTITSPASAANAFAVVAYITKPSAILAPSGNCVFAPDSNDLSPVSSRGPLRPCTACANQPAKPDLAAPGLMVVSSLSSRVSDDDLACQLDPDRRHYGLEGSSMAAPHVTGAAALLLQINRDLTIAQLKTYLLNNVAVPQVPPPHPVERWGQGRLNVKAAVDALRAAGDDPAPGVPTGLRVRSVHSQRVEFTWDAGTDLDLRSYRIYRRAETELADVLVAQNLPATSTLFQDFPDPLGTRGVLTNETAYIYTIEAEDISGQVSARSVELRAVPTAGEGSVGLCFIATAAYGSPWHPHVTSLRTFRDRHLRPHAVGRAVVAAYEAMSPPLARMIAPHPTLRAVTRVALTPLVLTIEHPRAAFALLGLGLLGGLGLALRRREP